MSANPNSPTLGEKGNGAQDVYTHDAHTHGACVPVPDFKRLNYFYGQMLGAEDFRAEQNYFREKLKLHNRCLHGYGVVCGLRVVPEPVEQPCSPETDARLRSLQEELVALKAELGQARAAGDEQKAKEIEARMEEVARELDRIRTEECDDEAATRVLVECGLAIDCEGNELVVRRPLAIDLWRELSRADREKLKHDWDDEHTQGVKQVKGKLRGGEANAGADQNGDGKGTLYLSICFCEQPTDLVRPVMADACGVSPACNYGKLRDSFKIRVTTRPPEEDLRCATCCEACPDPCLLLARIDNFRRGEELDPADIHNEVRRPVSLHVPTVITGVSWAHGADYTSDETGALLGVNPGGDDNPPSGHLVVRFSRPVLTSTIKRGVIDIWVVQGGRAEHADIYNLDVVLVEPPWPPDAQTPRTIDHVRFRVDSDEDLDNGDRVIITIRGSQLLDECCRPVDAANTGGRTPFLEDDEFKEFQRDLTVPECQSPPPFGYGPWTSGTNAAGADHVSWIYVRNPRTAQKQQQQQQQQ